jgi:uncharacterized repeat protein (TIGR02543 family)
LKKNSIKSFLAFTLLISSSLPALIFVSAPSSSAVTTSSSGTQTTLTYDYTNTVETFTIPANVTEITITVTGAQGGTGGSDYGVRPPLEGYRGVVSGNISVTPGRIISVAVGERGADPVRTGCTAGPRSDSGDANIATGGNNPLGIYKGGNGATPGPDGCSGYGGAGGAASVVKIGTLADAAADALIVAGGSGASGGNGQFQALRGGSPQANYSARTDTTSTNGQTGLNTYTACVAAPRPDGRCDGGGGAGGGGGAQGGARGEVPFGTGSNTEWYGLGSFPGQNATSGLSSLTSSYNYYTFSSVSTKLHGSVVISYSSGVPSSPSGVNGTPNNSGVDLYWTRPSTAGATSITDYQVEYAVSPYSSWTTASTCSGLSETCTVTGLTNGTAYKFKVKAQNSIGWGAYSELSQELTPSGPPSAPTITGITPGDGSLSVAFTAGASTATITDYQYSINGTNFFSLSNTTSPLVISGLTNGTPYPVVIRAVNAAGPGSTSNEITSTPSALPGAPTITNLVDGGSGTSLVVTFTAGYTGGSSITDYEYAVSVGLNSSDFGSYSSVGGTSSPFTITGLTNGTAYTVKLRAKNTAGYGPGSAFQNGVTLAAPNAPTITSVTSGDGRLRIIYPAYTSATNGGSAISKVEYSTNDGSSWADAGTLSETFTVLGLTNGTTYLVKLRAVNAIGTSIASSATSGTPAAPPSSPLQVSVLGNPTAAAVAWLAPSSNGGSAVTGYTASAHSASSGGSLSSSCTTANLTCTITGLTNGTTYYVSVVATNAAGSSSATSPRISVIPAALPGAPTISGITAGNAYLSVAFSAGTADSNAPITGYQYSSDNGTTWANASGTTSPLLVSSLTNGTTYTVKIRAVSAIGNGAASTGVAGTPYTVPSNVDPGSISYTAGNGNVIVSWTAPAANGSAITDTNVTAFSALVGGSSSGICSTTNATTTCTISGLSNGTTYYVSIETINGAGYSQRSTPRVAVMPGNSSSTTLAISSSSIVVNSYETLTATVTTGATGTVNFTNDGTSITGCSSVTISSNTATCVTNALAAGTRSIRANYSGNSSYASSVSSSASITVLDKYTITYDNRGGTQPTASAEFIVGGSALVLPTPTRNSYVFTGWYDASTNGTKLGDADGPYTPTSTRTVYARWVQTSLYGMGASTKIGTVTTVDGVGNGFSASTSSTSVQVDYVADALPAGTVIDVYLITDTTRAQTFITNSTSFVVNLLLAWKATDDTVPDTASGKPITMTITDSAIKRGAKLYALLGSTLTDLGAATSDGQATVQITQDPEIVVVRTVPDTATAVIGTAGDGNAVVSWTAPASSGGSDITGYTVTSSGGQTCATTSLTCTVTGLTNGTAYTFTVRATNAIGNSPVSTASSAVTPVAASTPAPSSSGSTGSGSSGGGSVASQPIAPVVTPTPAPVVTPEPAPVVTPTPAPVVTPTPAPVYVPTAPTNSQYDGAITREILQNSSVTIQQSLGNTVNMNSVVTFPSSGGISVSFTYTPVATGSSPVAPAPTQITVSLSTVSASGQPSQVENMTLVLSKGDDVKFSTGGLKANSEVSIYIFSEPTFLGKVLTNDNGDIAGTFPSPNGLSVGKHTIQMGAYLPDGSVASISLPVVVKITAKPLVVKVFFPMGSSVVTKSQIDTIKKSISTLKSKKNLVISIQGFVQKTSRQINDQLLAQNRASSVAKYLKKSGIQGKYTVVAKGYATERDARARRVKITIRAQ